MRPPGQYRMTWHELFCWVEFSSRVKDSLPGDKRASGSCIQTCFLLFIVADFGKLCINQYSHCRQQSEYFHLSVRSCILQQLSGSSSSTHNTLLRSQENPWKNRKNFFYLKNTYKRITPPSSARKCSLKWNLSQFPSHECFFRDVHLITFTLGTDWISSSF